MRPPLLLVAVLSACQLVPREEFDTFVAPRDSIDLAAHRYVLVPFTVQDDLDYPESVAVMIDSVVQATLEGAGIDVVPVGEYTRIWQRLTDEAQGFFDPYTGVRDDPKYEAAVAQLYRELKEEFQPFGFLYPELWVVEAPLRGSIASWDGVAVRVYPVPDDLLWLTALTFVVVIEDTTGTELFVNGRGIEVIEELDNGTMEMRFKSSDEILSDLPLIVETVEAVLALLTRVRSVAN